MNKAILTGLAVLSLAAMPCLARHKEKSYAPLPPQLLSVKMVLLTGGPPAVLDKAYAELGKWGRFQVVSDPAKADVIFEFRHEATAPNSPAGTITRTPAASAESLAVADAKTGELLYLDSRARTPGEGGAVGFFIGVSRPSMARSMLKELRKRIEAQEKQPGGK